MSSINLEICHSSFITTQPAALTLIKQFCACPAANVFMNENALAVIMGTPTIADPLTIPLSIEISKEFTHAMTHHGTIASGEKRAKIYLPQSSHKQLLSPFTFEIFNNQRQRFDKVFEEAKNGDLSMNDYGRKMEIEEIKTSIAADNLIEKCAKTWRLSVPLPLFLKDPTDPLYTSQVHLWYNDFSCHTDEHRKNWINHFQQTYCARHPEDQRSCSIRKENLCDLTTYSRASALEQGKIFAGRLCKLITNAPDEVKSYFKAVISSNCPNAMKNNGEL